MIRTCSALLTTTSLNFTLFLLNLPPHPHLLLLRSYIHVHFASRLTFCIIYHTSFQPLADYFNLHGTTMTFPYNYSQQSSYTIQNQVNHTFPFRVITSCVLVYFLCWKKVCVTHLPLNTEVHSAPFTPTNLFTLIVFLRWSFKSLVINFISYPRSILPLALIDC